MSEKNRNEKEEKDEKGQGESWDEKWRRDPIDAAAWALILIWAGLVLLATNMNWFGLEGSHWPWIFVGGGVIVLVGVVLRLVMPAYRRPIVGSLIFGAILLGIGLGNLYADEDWVWAVIVAAVLIIIGGGLLLRGFLPRE